jgi:tetratricopeptide (TPR) repeat protein
MRTALGHAPQWASSGGFIESRIELETAITLDPNNVRAFRQLGYTLMQLGKPDAAIPLIEKGIRLSPFNSGTPGAYQVLGLCHLLLGDIEQAIIYSRKSLAENPRLYYTYTHLAAEFALKGDLAQARAALTEGIRLKPELCSVTRVCASLPYSHPEYMALVEDTVIIALRRLGFPE